MPRQALARSPILHSIIRANGRNIENTAWRARPTHFQQSLVKSRTFTSTRWTLEEQKDKSNAQEHFEPSYPSLPPNWEDEAELAKISRFADLPHEHFGYNQHIKINEDFKEDLRQVLWQFRAPIRYAFAYGSGVFGQSNTTGGDADGMSPHPNPSKAVQEWQSGGAKIIDFIFGVSHTQHWHSLNLGQYPEHYSGLKYLPYSSAAISKVQDSMGAGVYFNPYITVNGTMIKYGVVNLDTLASDLSEWNTLYLAGRLQKPVKILRDDPRVRLANQVNLISALRTALLMLPEKFTERQLYERIAGLSYMGDPRMNTYFSGENPNKVSNIVGAQLPGFRQLYVPLISTLPNLAFTDSRTPSTIGWEKEDAIRHTGSSPALHDVLGGADGLQLQQDMDPQKRGNMVRRLPKAFRTKLYWSYKKQFGIPGSAFDSVLEAAADEDATAAFKKREAGDFERRIAAQENLSSVMAKTVTQTVAWPSTSQTIKSFFTAGIGRAWRYYSDKRRKSKEKAKKDALKKKESVKEKKE